MPLSAGAGRRGTGRRVTAPRVAVRGGGVAAVPPPALKVGICQGKHCRKKCSANLLALVELLAPASVVVKRAGCMDECPMGPNIRFYVKHEDESGARIVNGVSFKDPKDLAALLEQRCAFSEEVAANLVALGEDT